MLRYVELSISLVYRSFHVFLILIKNQSMIKLTLYFCLALDISFKNILKRVKLKQVDKSGWDSLVNFPFSSKKLYIEISIK